MKALLSVFIGQNKMPRYSLKSLSGDLLEVKKIIMHLFEV